MFMYNMALQVVEKYQVVNAAKPHDLKPFYDFLDNEAWYIPDQTFILGFRLHEEGELLDPPSHEFELNYGLYLNQLAVLQTERKISIGPAKSPLFRSP